MRAIPLLSALLVATTAHAHIQLDEPSPRYLDQKGAPCGKGDGHDARTANVHTFRPGETIGFSWTETIDHAGYFRISFDADGADATDFDDPANFLLSSMTDPAGTNGQVWTATVTLPDVVCDNCTLQLIQDMGGTDYYQCVDVVLREDDGGVFGDGGSDEPAELVDAGPPPSFPPAPPASEDDGTSGCTQAAVRGWTSLLALLAASRARERRRSAATTQGRSQQGERGR